MTGSAVRATDLVRALAQFKTDEFRIAKLFAKHIKFSEAVTRCTGSRFAIGVGTPTRILGLIRDGI